MKRILALATALLLTAFAAVPAVAGPYSIVFTQKNEFNTGNVLKTPQQPPVDAIVFFNSATNLADYLRIGPGLVASGGVLQAAVPQGPVGPQGAIGNPGRDGTNGVDGKSAYELATVDGFSGTLQAWLASLKGAAGADGKDGASIVGPAGPQGLPGIGTKGDKGDTGATGAQGNPGTPAPTFNFGLPASRTLVLTTPYQAANPAKPAIVTVSPVCTASLTLSGGGTCTMQARIGVAPLTCASGTVVATWSNGNTGTLSVGLAMNQTIGSPYGINLPTGASFILCPNAGTFTVTASEQSAG
jgi:hypothetical protein